MLAASVDSLGLDFAPEAAIPSGSFARAGPCNIDAPAATASNTDAARIRCSPAQARSAALSSMRNMAILLIKVPFAGRNALAGQHGRRPSCRSASRDRLRKYRTFPPANVAPMARRRPAPAPTGGGRPTSALTDDRSTEPWRPGPRPP